MGKLMRMLVVAGVAAGGGYIVYNHVLSDQDRASITNAVDSAKSLYKEVANRIKPLVQQQENQDTSNRDQTLRQWADLGF